MVRPLEGAVAADHVARAKAQDRNAMLSSDFSNS
jgi:hypothetical protein